MRFTTVAGPSVFHLDPIKNSRFVATVDRVRTEDEAHALIERVRHELGDARHHCWAWCLTPDLTRSSDDGEPSGSAGRPILAQIEGHDLLEVGVVVSRWFGGVKLGVGGLMRAYGGCAGKALDRAETIAVVPHERLWVVHDYSDTASVDALLGQRGLEKTDGEWGANVRFALDLPYDEIDGIAAELVDRTGGRVTVDRA